MAETTGTHHATLSVIVYTKALVTTACKMPTSIGILCFRTPSRYHPSPALSSVSYKTLVNRDDELFDTL